MYLNLLGHCVVVTVMNSMIISSDKIIIRLIFHSWSQSQCARAYFFYIPDLRQILCNSPALGMSN